MKEGDKKCTTEEIEAMVDLYKKGFSSEEIGKALKRNHTTPLFWLRRKGIPRRGPGHPRGIRRGEIGRFTFRGKEIEIRRPPRFSADAREKEEKLEKELEEERRRKSEGLCLRCGKKKTEKWKRTLYCSLSCWDLYYNKPVTHSY